MAGELLGREVQLTVEDADCKGGLCISLTQTQLTSAALTSRYHIEVRAKTDDGTFPLGSFDTCPPVSGSEPTRIVATAACPGALAWALFVRPWELVSETPPDYGDLSGMIHAAAGEPGGQLPGVVRVGERSKYYAGTGLGNVLILPGETVVGWSAFSTGAGLTVAIGSGPAIACPPAGGVSGGSGALIKGPVEFQFGGANLGGYLIEVAQSA